MSTCPADPTTLLEPWRLGDVLRSRLAALGSNNTVYVVDLGDCRVVVRVYRNLDAAQVASEHALLAAVAATDLPFRVPVPLPTPDGSTWVSTADGPAAVFGWLDGTRPDPTPDALERVGRALGELDRALAGLDPGLAIHDWLRRDGLAATHPAVSDLTGLTAEFGAAPGDLADVDAAYTELVRDVPAQLVHDDVGLSNVLERDGTVTALLDFEVAGTDLRVCDPVAAMVNVGCLEPAAEPLARAEALLRGYGQVVRLTPAELTALPVLLRFRSAASAVWRYGKYLRGQVAADDVRRHVRDLDTTTRWTHTHGDALVTLAAACCG